MSKSSKDLGNNRFRESFGRYFEEFEVGHIYEHRPGRTITESDNTWFTLLTMNTHPLHFDKECLSCWMYFAWIDHHYILLIKLLMKKLHDIKNHYLRAYVHLV